jgi:hypothetical protein
MPWEPEVLEQAVPPLDEPVPISKPPTEPYDGPELQLAEFLEGVEVIREAADGLGVKYQIICPWVHEHTSGDRTGTRIGQRVNGALWFHCDHEHCQGRTWREFRQKVQRCSSRSIRITRPGYTGTPLEVTINRG